MSKIHISLVGGQTTPVYMGILAAQPDNVILIHSDSTKNETNQIIKELSSSKIIFETQEFDPVDLKKIDRSIKKLQNSIKNFDDISLNLVGGTKSWALSFYSAFVDCENVTIYLVDQFNNLWDFRQKKAIKLPFDFESNFRLQGNPLIYYTLFSNYTQEDIDLVHDIEFIRRKDFNDFKELTGDNKLDNFGERITTNKLSRVQWVKPDRLFFKIKDTEISLTSPHAVQIAFNTAWFELKIANLLSNFYPRENIYMNCVFPLQGTNIQKNEVDILINTGETLLFVECKTQILNSTDIDKFRTVVTNYGGQASKALFVTDAKMKNVAIEKCEKSNIAHFSLSDHTEESLLDDLRDVLYNVVFKVNK